MPKSWECPDCGETEETHGNQKERPFCDPCEWRHGVLIEMQEVA